MKIPVALVCAALMVGSVGCGKESQDDPYRDQKVKRAPQKEDRYVWQNEAGSSAGNERAGLQESFTMELLPSNPTVTSDLQLRISGIDQESVLEALWLVNQKPVEGEKSLLLPAGNFKKNDWVQCWVKRSGSDNWMKSGLIRIANSPPQVQALPVSGIELPGEIRYQVQASDADGDKLNYRLAGALAGEGRLDPDSGLLVWKLNDNDLIGIGDSYEVRIVVSDGSGGEASFSVRFSFAAREQ